jgi:hypothetical protein
MAEMMERPTSYSSGATITNPNPGSGVDRDVLHLVIVSNPDRSIRHHMLFTNPWVSFHVQSALRHYYSEGFPAFRGVPEVVVMPTLWMRHEGFLYHQYERLPLVAALRYARCMDQAFMLPPELVPQLIGESDRKAKCLSLFRRRSRPASSHYSFMSFEDLNEILR